MDFYIGVDPGNSGAAAMINANHQIIDVFKFKDATMRDIFETFVEWATWPEGDMKIYAMIEKVHSMPAQGVKSVFTFGENFGALQMALTASGIPYDYVTPQRWQTQLGCKSKGDKNVTKAKAQREWSYKKITHAIADALLIALYCKEMKG